jgi:hypothetical protein
MELNMEIFNQRINSIAQAKVLSRAINKKNPSLTFAGLSAKQQESLVAALINEDEEIRELIANKITNALEDAYCDELRPSEAIDDAIDLSRFAQEDIESRTRDMQLAMGGR